MDIFQVANSGRIGSQYWVNSEDRTFSELAQDNFQLYNEWKHSSYIHNSDYKNKILKPINYYSLRFGKKPELIVDQETVSLRYKTHAEIWVEPREEGLYALDKTWQRQFYPSSFKSNIPSNCFNAMYKFYIPWLIDEDVECEIKNIEESPFVVLNTSVNFVKTNNDLVWNCDWFHFAFKNNSPLIETYREKQYGIVEIESPICDIIIKDRNIASRLVEEYEK